MNNYIILKWGSLKAYNFTDDFIKENEEIVKELGDIWDTIYSEKIGAIYGFTDEYYNNFNEIKDYIMSYGG